jgi:RNA polymerase sigma factor (sigma-70 family)
METKKDSHEEDLKLINLIKNSNCNDSFKRLQSKHSNLFYSVCNKFTNKVDLDEIYKDKDFVMYKAVMSFKPEKGAKYSTWLGNYSRYHCLNYIKNNHKYVITDEDKMKHFFNLKSIDEYDCSRNPQDDLDHAFDILEKLKDKRIFRIFKLRYMHEGPRLTWKEIAEKFDLTPQTIINLHMKGRRILKKKMRFEKILDKR